MFLQKRKNIQGNSSLFKTVHIPFDKLTDSFVLRKTVYHETSLVKFSDEVTHNMPVCVKTKTNKLRYYMQQIAKKQKQQRTIPKRAESNVYQVVSRMINKDFIYYTIKDGSISYSLFYTVLYVLYILLLL